MSGYRGCSTPTNQENGATPDENSSMTTAFFTVPGRFFRGNLHTHLTRSDGVLLPNEVCCRYRAHGYDFLALTDHFKGRFG
jgi:hypothetical protein